MQAVTALLEDQVRQGLIPGDTAAVAVAGQQDWGRKRLGYGGAVVTRRSNGGPLEGSYGWTGGFGTSCAIDPAAGVVTMLLTQRLMRRADDTAIAEAFRRTAYQTEVSQGSSA